MLGMKSQNTQTIIIFSLSAILVNLFTIYMYASMFFDQISDEHVTCTLASLGIAFSLVLIGGNRFESEGTFMPTIQTFTMLLIVTLTHFSLLNLVCLF